MHLHPYLPSSTRDPNHPQPYPTMHWDPLPLHLGLVPRHSSDNNPSASGMQTPSGITWPSCDDHATTCHLCHLIGRPPSWQTWDLRVPTLFSSNLFLSYCIPILLWLLC